MILATRGGDREVRLFERSSDVPMWQVFSGYVSQATSLGDMQALALPTVGAAVRLISETIGGLPLHVYSGFDAGKRKAQGTLQWHLLNDAPNPDQTAFDLLCDVAACVEGWGNAYARKTKVRGQVVALDTIDPVIVNVKRGDDGGKVFDVHWPDGVERLTTAQVIHFRGWTPRGGLVGWSPIAMHRESLGSAAALQRFQSKFYDNDATPGLYISVPGDLDEEGAVRIKSRWVATHGGDNRGGVAVIGNGAEVKPLTIPMRDAQYIETQQHGAELAARIFLGPASSLLGADKNQKTEEESLRFVNFCLLPRLRRIASAFTADFDLFPDQSPLYPEWHIDEFLRADAATRAEVQHKQIQSGLLLIDEGRAELGRPPLPDGIGQIPQITPVGGAPNPALTAPTPPEE